MICTSGSAYCSAKAWKGVAEGCKNREVAVEILDVGGQKQYGC